MTSVVLSLGSNLGDRVVNLQDAINELVARHLVSNLRASSVYETAPIGGPEQAPFLNIVCIGDTVHSPYDLLRETQQIEKDLGRTRTVHWGPRLIDIDIITFGDAMISDPTLDIPHARAFQRAFVLKPWLELDSQALLPGFGLASQFLAKLSEQEIIRHEGFSRMLKSGQ